MQEKARTLTEDTQVVYPEDNTALVEFTHDRWALTLTFDLELQELVLKTVIGPDRWLALGFASDLLDASVIQWVTSADFLESGSATERIAVRGVLLPTPHDNLRVTQQRLEASKQVEFATLRAFDTGDPLDIAVAPDATLQLAFASGRSAATPWEARDDHGYIELLLATQEPVSAQVSAGGDLSVVEAQLPFNEARISAYEVHGWLCLAAWFPLGFALIATKRYYKTRWFLMHHLHNLIGFAVTAVTIVTCL